jgi:hypothetical protein
MTYYFVKVLFLARSRNTIMKLIKKNKFEMRLNCDAEMVRLNRLGGVNLSRR